jgi:predicted O-methyltransferase YrrM
MRKTTSTSEGNKIVDEFWRTERKADLQVYEQRFLNSLLLQKKPKNVLEIGVATGGSSALILNALKTNDNSAKLYSVDYDTQYFGYRTKKTGFWMHFFQLYFS